MTGELVLGRKYSVIVVIDVVLRSTGGTVVPDMVGG